MYELPPRITKELLLSKNSQETYFEHYLGLSIKKGNFCSPAIIRRDKNPTCAFYKNSRGNLIYKDFAGPTFDFVGCVMHIFNCSYYKGLQIIANDFGFISNSKLIKNVAKIKYSGNILKQTEKAKIQVELKPFSKKEMEWWNSFGVRDRGLAKYHVYSIKSIFLNGNYFDSSTDTSPIYGYYGGTNSDGDELWRIYRPSKRKYRFLSNWPATKIQGVKQLPKTGSHCILIKSKKDVMVLEDFGFISCSTVSENILITEAQFNKIMKRFNNNLIVFFDNDLAGVKGANKYKKKYKVRCIFLKRKYAKDISDMYKKVSETVFWTIVEELEGIIKDSTIRKTKHFYTF